MIIALNVMIQGVKSAKTIIISNYLRKSVRFVLLNAKSVLGLYLTNVHSVIQEHISSFQHACYNVHTTLFLLITMKTLKLMYATNVNQKLIVSWKVNASHVKIVRMLFSNASHVLTVVIYF